MRSLTHSKSFKNRRSRSKNRRSKPKSKFKNRRSRSNSTFRFRRSKSRRFFFSRSGGYNYDIKKDLENLIKEGSTYTKYILQEKNIPKSGTHLGYKQHQSKSPEYERISKDTDRSEDMIAGTIKMYLTSNANERRPVLEHFEKYPRQSLDDQQIKRLDIVISELKKIQDAPVPSLEKLQEANPEIAEIIKSLG